MNQRSIERIHSVVQNHRFLAGQFLRDPLRLPVAMASDPLPVVIFSQVAWDGVWQRPQEQAIGLSKHRPVLYIGPVQLHDPAPTFAGTARILRPKGTENLTVFSPMLLSGEYRSPAVRMINHAILRRALRNLRGKPFIALANSPFFGDVIARLRPKLLAVDMIDDFCAFDWAPRDARQQEEALLRRAHLGFAGTSQLFQQYRTRIRSLRFLQNGVRFEELNAPQPEPTDIAALPRPRYLYTGTLNDRLDGSLIGKLAAAQPNASIILVGPKYESFNAPKAKNIHYLGLRPHSALPGYLQHCDVGLLPYADNEAARATNPTKTLEYLAVGLPVLSTPIPDVQRFFATEVSVKTPDEWPEEAARLMKEETATLREKRRRFAMDYRWQSVIDRMEKAFRDAEKRYR